MAAHKRTPEEQWDAIREAALDDLADEIDAMTSEEVDALLNAHGGDAAGTRRRAGAQMAAIQERQARLGDWQAEAQAKLAAARATFAAVRGRRPKLTRPELIARIEAAKNDPRFGQPVATFFRKRATSETTDEELEAFLDEIEALRELEGSKKEPK
jgi:hypothetical protein